MSSFAVYPGEIVGSTPRDGVFVDIGREQDVFVSVHIIRKAGLEGQLSRGVDVDVEVDLSRPLRKGKKPSARGIKLSREYNTETDVGSLEQESTSDQPQGGPKQVSGILRDFSRDKVHGFVQVPDHPDAYVNAVILPQGVTPSANLNGQWVTAEVVQRSDGRWRAISVAFTDKSVVISGYIKFFKWPRSGDSRAFGFIEIEGENDLFLPFDSLPKDVQHGEDLRGLEVTAEIRTARDGRRFAVNVNFVEDDCEEEDSRIAVLDQPV